MEIYKTAGMVRGWFVGDFVPAAYRTDAAEVAIKTYDAGELEAAHFHKVATEITAIVAGSARMGDKIVETGDIVVVQPGEVIAFAAITEVTAVVVKVPSVADDKYPAP